MKALNDLNIFVETARQSSFSQAAHSLDLTPAAVSAAIKRLESQLGFALFVRSTRSLRLTNEGDILLQRTQSALSTIQEGLDQIAQSQGEISGTLNLSAPSDFGRNQLLSWLDEFMELHPNLSINLDLSDGITNLYHRPIDLAIRYGTPPDSNFVALPICRHNTRVICASPEYVQNKPAIVKPSDLLAHQCLCFMLSDTYHNRWTFWRDGNPETVVVKSRLSANDGDVVHRWAVNGRGVAYKSLLDISQDIIDGRLLPLLSEWQSEPCPVYLVCADKRLLNHSTRALHQFLQSKCEQRMRQVKDIMSQRSSLAM
ncbi:LysR family transcriptional regulator [Vibrio ostreae]|uniref:LysR family transcriptional regulator n=1 Tax=Vibrio ostreae TaxID=2841925 RepID=A0A975UBS7_9VIBR|nr:LysR family transcriptional regulator [Vibrio ostreae]QXO18665.1 LysR family transcriptional regulator [Vibrio ostreae]